MGSRLKLRELLKQTLGNDVQLYFQAPPNTGMSYPCVLYAIDDVDTKHADNRGYVLTDRYLITVMERDSDAQIWRKLLELPSANFVRTFAVDSLYHTLINLHFEEN